jgi:hypothetical protein
VTTRASDSVPLLRWSSAELADEAVTAGVVESISASTVRRRLRRDGLKLRDPRPTRVPSSTVSYSDHPRKALSLGKRVCTDASIP